MLERSIVAFAQLGAEWVLWVLVVLSVLSVAVMIERALFYLARRADPKRLEGRLGALLDDKDVAGAKKLLEGDDTMEAHVVRAGLDQVHKGEKVAEETMAAELSRQKARFDARLIFLGTLGNNAPFIGLFGTVLGIIKAFKDLALADAGAAGGNAQVVMAGISEALVATAVGLAVALPAVVAFNYFKTVVKRSVQNAQTLSRTVVVRIDALEEE
ncbi:MAG: MotA/TolQ/ExbB proton channel family protein [Deltaproteobacteria bacterium]|jgi:biopolymer transport protein ExbB